MERHEPDSAPLHQPEAASSWRVPALVSLALAAVVAGAGYLWLTNAPADARPPESLPPLNAVAEAYLPQIEIGRLELSRFENMLGQEVLYVDADIHNRGARLIRGLELTLEFTDVNQQPVLTQRVRAVGDPRAPLGSPRRSSLAPGQSLTARFAFEDLPREWNRGAPRVRVSALLLGEAGPAN
ncbi:MAG: hypothetical protein L0212_12715 [Acidobacteria bacterium]|nr:hypothetical protein [Acidobacteriota bacterium]